MSLSTDCKPKLGAIDYSRVTAVYPEMAGKAAVITGAARGMGATFAAGLVARGVDIIAADVDAASMERSARTISVSPLSENPGRIVVSVADVRVAEAHEQLAQRALDEFGRLDFWINNAGVFPFAPIADISPEQISTALAVNVEGVLFGAQAAARHMTNGGAIVNISSVLANKVRRGRGAYCTSKAAVSHLTESLAVELGDKGIRVNALAPANIETDMTRWMQDDPSALKTMLESLSAHRFGSPEDALGPLLFLLSDSARYVTGHSLAVDGGSLHV